jgi:putative hydrolase of the HAD superfamily
MRNDAEKTSTIYKFVYFCWEYTEMREVLAEEKKVQAIIFDVGGVLLHPDGELMVRALEPVVGYRLDPQICQASFLLTDHQLVSRVVGEREKASVWANVLHLPSHLALQAWKVIVQLDSEIPNLWGKIDSDTLDLLSTLLARGFTLSVLSNARGNVEKLLLAAGFTGFFADIVDSALVGLEKPDPRSYLLAAQRLGISPGSCAYVGDSLAEIEMAGRLGMYPVLYDRCGLYTPASEFSVLRQLCLLPKLLSPLERDDVLQ